MTTLRRESMRSNDPQVQDADMRFSFKDKASSMRDLAVLIKVCLVV